MTFVSVSLCRNRHLCCHAMGAGTSSLFQRPRALDCCIVGGVRRVILAGFLCLPASSQRRLWGIPGPAGRVGPPRVTSRDWGVCCSLLECCSCGLQCSTPFVRWIQFGCHYNGGTRLLACKTDIFRHTFEAERLLSEDPAQCWWWALIVPGRRRWSTA